jgi:hypothetical protein
MGKTWAAQRTIERQRQRNTLRAERNKIFVRQADFEAWLIMQLWNPYRTDGEIARESLIDLSKRSTRPDFADCVMEPGAN